MNKISKKLILGFVSIILIFTFAFIQTNAVNLNDKDVTTKKSSIIGDSNGDGFVDAIDATIIQKFLAKILTQNEIVKENSDVNNDACVDVIDSTIIQKYLAKLCNIDGSKPYSEESSKQTEPTINTIATVPTETYIDFSTQLDTPYINYSKLSGTEVFFSWDKIENAYGYRVFYKRASWNSWKFLADTLNTTYTDSGLKYKLEYQYTVSCIDKDGNFASDYDPVGLKVCVTKLNTPIISNASLDHNTVKLSWNPISGAYKYRVFYKQSTWSSYKALANTTSTSYTDTGLKIGITYVYTVRCVDEDGNFASDYDSIGYAVKATKLFTPYITSIKGDGNSAIITWNKISGAYKYRVFYKHYGESSYKALANTSSTTYTDTNLASGITYVYTVRCIGEDGQFTSDYDASGEEYTYYAPYVLTKYDLVLNTNSMIYHLPSCDSAKRISAKNRYNVYASYEEVENWGYSPCQRCIN